MLSGTHSAKPTSGGTLKTSYSGIHNAKPLHKAHPTASLCTAAHTFPTRVLRDWKDLAMLLAATTGLALWVSFLGWCVVYLANIRRVRITGDNRRTLSGSNVPQSTK